MMELLKLIICQWIEGIGYALMHIGAKINYFALLKCVPKECRDENYKELLENYSILFDLIKKR